MPRNPRTSQGYYPLCVPDAAPDAPPSGEQQAGAYRVSRQEASVEESEQASALAAPDVLPPTRTGLDRLGPNPFRGTVRIRFGVAGGEPVQLRLKVYNIQGRLVRAVLEGAQEPGWHVVRWDGRDSGGVPVASGVYFVRMEGPALRETRKMVLLH